MDISAPRMFSTKQIVIGVILSALVLILAGGTFFFYTSHPFKTYVEQGTNAFFLPGELRSAVFVQKTPNGTRVLAPALFGYTQVQAFSTSTISFSRTGSSYAAVVENTPGQYQIVVAGKTVLTSPLPIVGTSISADGRDVLFSMANDAVATTTLLSFTDPTPVFDPSQFKIFEISSGQGSPALPNILPRYIGPGIASLFLDGTHALYVAFGGVVYTDLADRTTTSVALSQFISTLRIPVLQSPDHSHIAWYDARTQLLQVYGLTAGKMQKISAITLPPPYIFSVGNSGIYELRFSKNGTEVWMHSFDGKTVRNIYTLPGTLGITQLVF